MKVLREYRRRQAQQRERRLAAGKVWRAAQGTRPRGAGRASPRRRARVSTYNSSSARNANTAWLTGVITGPSPRNGLIEQECRA